MSYLSEKPPETKPFNTLARYESETDWVAFDTLGNSDIVINEDCPEMTPEDFQGGTLCFNGRTPTPEEMREGERLLVAYLNKLTATD